jgi:peptidoglycan/xylan/chitin deacetylase (PgdA/CDA1 family)
MILNKQNKPDKSQSINKSRIIKKNSVLRLCFKADIKPNWLEEDSILLFVPELYQNKETKRGKVLAEFFDGEKYYPAIIKLKNQTIFNFDPYKTMDILLNEKYVKRTRPIYSYLPFHYHKIPFRAILAKLMRNKEEVKYPSWPNDCSVEVLKHLVNNTNLVWKKNKKCAVVLTHDVDTKHGLKNIARFTKIEEEFGFTSTINIVSNYYKLDHKLLTNLKSKGFEIASHGYNHDNKLAYLTKKKIKARFNQAKYFFSKYDVKGFRSPSLLMSKNLNEVLPEFFEYCSSVPDTERFIPDAKSSGACTLFPFVKNNGLIEVPLTVPMDSSLIFLGYQPKEILNIWIQKIEWIKKLGGVATIITHPEPHFSANKEMLEIYRKLMVYLANDKNVWVVDNVYQIVKIYKDFCKRKVNQ